MDKLRIATRKSPLALRQAALVQARLGRLYPDVQVELLGLTTRGDRIQDRPLAEVGGKGLFIKELEVALSDGRADLAVHSCKDLPGEMPPGFTLAAVCEREDPRDALLYPMQASPAGLADLVPGARVGTSSNRRRAQLLALRPDLQILPLRGNLGTRLARLDAGDYDAIVLAAAGLVRLGQQERISCLLDPQQLLPAPGQGALAIECCAENADIMEKLQPLVHEATHARVLAERAVARQLQASCEAAMAAHASLAPGGRLQLAVRVLSHDGRQQLAASGESVMTEAEELGQKLATELLEAGAANLLGGS